MASERELNEARILDSKGLGAESRWEEGEMNTLGTRGTNKGTMRGRYGWSTLRDRQSKKT